MPVAPASHYVSGGVRTDLGKTQTDLATTISQLQSMKGDLSDHSSLIARNHDELELLKHKGVSYAIIGSMGGLPDPEPTYRSPASLWFKQGGYGWLDLDIDATGIALAFKASDGFARANLPARLSKIKPREREPDFSPRKRPACKSSSRCNQSFSRRRGCSRAAKSDSST